MFEELGSRLEDPEIMADTDELLRVSKERAKLEPTVTAYQEYLEYDAQLTEARELFSASSDDAEMREMAREEVGGAGEGGKEGDRVAREVGKAGEGGSHVGE